MCWIKGGDAPPSRTFSRTSTRRSVRRATATRASQLVIPPLQQNRWGRIINIADIAAKCDGDRFGRGRRRHPQSDRPSRASAWCTYLHGVGLPSRAPPISPAVPTPSPSSIRCSQRPRIDVETRAHHAQGTCNSGRSDLIVRCDRTTKRPSAPEDAANAKVSAGSPPKSYGHSHHNAVYNHSLQRRPGCV